MKFKGGKSSSVVELVGSVGNSIFYPQSVREFGVCE